MTEPRYDLLIQPKGGALCHYQCAGGQSVAVRDLLMHLVIQVRPDEISLYRHALHLDGTDYNILNIRRLA